MSRFIRCDACHRDSYRTPGIATALAEYVYLQRYRARGGRGGEWQTVVRPLDGGGELCLDACCDGCAAELRRKRYERPRRESEDTQ